MFHLIMNTFRLLFLSIVLPIRKKSKHRITQLGVIYTQQFSQNETMFDLEISQTRFQIKYQCWFIPNVTENVYRATIKDSKTGKELYVQHYPLLSLPPMFDPMYPSICISQIHIEDFIHQYGEPYGVP